MNPKNRVHWLVLAHVVAGLTGSGFCAMTRGYNVPALTAQPSLLALLLCQGTLLGVWAVFSSRDWRRRVVVTVVSVLCLDLLANVSLRFDPVIPVVSINTLATAGILSLLRISHVGLRCIRVQVGAALAEPAGSLRPSTRGLMFITGLVAALLWGAMWLRKVPREQESLVMAAGFAGLVAVDLLSLRVALGEPRPLLRGAIVLATSLALGALYSYTVHSPDLHVSLSIVAGFALESALLQGSLLVVRSCGWRLVSRPGERRPVVPRMATS
jgi:hypothetical protein